MSKRMAAWALGLCVVTSMAWTASPMDSGVAELQHDWESVRYQTPTAEKAERWARLATKAQQVVAQHPQRAEPLIWQGIVLSSWAADKGGLGALSMVKEAKVLYEKALAINPNALDGSAYNSLGVLYLWRVLG
jgi:hypothetical protein